MSAGLAVLLFVAALAAALAVDILVPFDDPCRAADDVESGSTAILPEDR